MESLTVFSRPSQKELDRYRRQKGEEQRYKDRMNNLGEDVRVNLSRDR